MQSVSPRSVAQVDLTLLKKKMEKKQKKKVWFEPVNVLATPVFSCVYFAGEH